jgi:catechol-2,3-dioxygenase
MEKLTFKTLREQARLVPLRLEHAVLRTTQLQPMLDWYRTVLLAEVAFSNDWIAFLAYDEQNHRIAIVAREGTTPRPPNSTGLDHLAFAYANIEELIFTYERLKALGIVPIRAVDHGSSTSIYYMDPDQNQIELKVDNFDTVQEQHAWLRTEAFAKNPAGTPLDLDELVSQFRAKTPSPGRVSQ